jgi:hypothetical protein
MSNRLRHHVVTMFLTLGLIAGGGMALAAIGSDTPTDTASACPTDSVTPTAAPDVTASDATDPTGEDQQGDDEQGDDEQGDDQQSCDDEQGEDVSGDETGATETPAPPADTTNPDRATECNTAAGVDPTAPPADPTVKVTGLDNAVAHVLANCLKNPDAPGLPNALAHLVANAERKALHDAAKAAGVHGHSGEVHGNSANAPGHSGEHGNPHV